MNITHVLYLKIPEGRLARELLDNSLAIKIIFTMMKLLQYKYFLWKSIEDSVLFTSIYLLQFPPPIKLTSTI